MSAGHLGICGARTGVFSAWCSIGRMPFPIYSLLATDTEEGYVTVSYWDSEFIVLPRSPVSPTLCMISTRIWATGCIRAGLVSQGLTSGPFPATINIFCAPDVPDGKVRIQSMCIQWNGEQHNTLWYDALLPPSLSFDGVEKLNFFFRGEAATLAQLRWIAPMNLVPPAYVLRAAVSKLSYMGALWSRSVRKLWSCSLVFSGTLVFLWAAGAHTRLILLFTLGSSFFVPPPTGQLAGDLRLKMAARLEKPYWKPSETSNAGGLGVIFKTNKNWDSGCRQGVCTIVHVF